MKIGILGGTFDPVHNTHITIANAALKQFNLDKVFLMPTPYPPHKDKSTISSNFHRANMIKLAIEGHENIYFSDFELNLKDTVYTADTLTMLNELYPNDDFYFIIGSDSIVSFMSWYHPDVIVKNATVLTVKRDDESGIHMHEAIAKIEDCLNTKIGIINIDATNVSSSFIRTNNYENIEKFVDKKVFDYIVSNNLYNNKNVNKAWSLSKIIEDLKDTLKDSRFEHTINVAQTAKLMAESFGENPNKAFLAGVLHDCAKNLSDSELLDICNKNHIDVSKIENTSKFLLHGKVGAFIAKTKYFISDEEILNAIKYHTTGRDNMTRLEQIVFCADYIEPGRTKQPNLEELRGIAYKDLDLLTFKILADTLDYLESKGNPIDNNTKIAYEYYKKLVEER